MATRKMIELDDSQGRAQATEQFLHYLHRSTELLRSDRPEDAKRLLSEAFEAKGQDPSGQATLALVYFKLGLYPRALALLKQLVENHPNDPVLNLNLALVLFKTGHTAQARSTLEHVIRLSPSYTKAYGYLGLACQRLGDYEAAAAAFKKGGADHMAKRLASFVEPEVAGTNDPKRGEAPAPPPSPSIQAEPLLSSLTGPHPAQVAPVKLSKEPGALREPLPVSELASQARLEEPLAGRFLISASGYLLANVADRLMTRMKGLHFCSSEGLSYTPVHKCHQGDELDDHFQGDDGPMCKVEGVGRLGFHPGDQVFNAVRLSDEIAYIREETVFSFDPDLTFENGRLPGADDALVHFRGRGSVVFKSPSTPHSIEVTPDRGVVIPAEGLVGWFGRLLPSTTTEGPFDETLETIEFTGEGILVFCLP